MALRVYAIDRLPPGLFGDESVEGLDALDVLAGNYSIWFHAHLGREPLFVYLVALAYKFFGVTPLATRLPAIIAGIATIPATYWLVREWAAEIFDQTRANRVAILTTILIAISFWHIQMSRNAHRDTLLPLVEAIGYALLWRAFRTHDWRAYAGAGAILGLAIYTYSPGRFVGVFVALFVAIEFVIWMLIDERRKTKDKGALSVFRHPSFILHLIFAGIIALIVMLPLGIYFVQNPAQFSRRFDSTSIFDQPSPEDAFTSSVAGNLAQFVVPDAGYQSKHYNLPGKPIFDLFLAPWFLAGIVIALKRIKQSHYRFLLLWFIVMCVPAFLTADMIPKGVRVLGVVPGVFIFIALAMDALLERAYSASMLQVVETTDRARLNRMELAPPQPFAIVAAFGLIAVCVLGSTLWTTYDYFVAWANLPELPLAFDADQTEVASFIHRQPASQTFVISYDVYRPPTLMLLGENVATSRYLERATRFAESNAKTTLIEKPDALYIFMRDNFPADEWLRRLAPSAHTVEQGEFFTAYRLGEFAPPQLSLDLLFNPFLKLIGVSRFPEGVAVYWQVAVLPADRQDIDATFALLDEHDQVVTQDRRRLGAPPLEWSRGDTIVDWFAIDATAPARKYSIELKRGADSWKSSALPLP